MAHSEEMKYSGKKYHIQYYTGRVIGSKKFRDNRVFGYNDTTSSGHVFGSINTRIVVHTEFFLVDNSGNEKNFHLVDFDFPIRDEQLFTVFWVVLDGQDSGIIFMVYDHNTQEKYFSPSGRLSEIFQINIVNLLVVNIGIFFVLMLKIAYMFPSSVGPDVNGVIHGPGGFEYFAGGFCSFLLTMFILGFMLVFAKISSNKKAKNFLGSSELKKIINNAISVGLVYNNNNEIQAKNELQPILPIFDAAEKGQYEKVMTLIQSKNDLVYKRDNDGLTPLHFAVMGNHEDVVRLLLNSKADVDAETFTGSTPLHIAVLSANKNIVEMLLGAGADPKKKTYKGTAVIHGAAIRGDKAIIELLLENGAKINVESNDGDTPIHCAAREGNREIVGYLLSEGSNINIKDKKYGVTPLHEAVKSGNTDLVSMLIANGADVNSKMFDNTTPLTAAKLFGKIDIIEILIRSGAHA
jgi:ankyrin repeat protein